MMAELEVGGAQDVQGKQWYCAQLVANREKSFREGLKKRIEQMGGEMGACFGEILMPAEEVVEIKRGKRMISKRKFFPNYVFIHMDMTPETWHLVTRMPMIKGFVGDTNTSINNWEGPQPIGDEEIDRIRSKIREGEDKPRPKVMFEIGESVRIKEGPFNNFTGNVHDVNYESNRISVSVSVFDRPTDIQLDFDQVEKM